jgi:ATP-dependent helicase HrpB
VESMMQRLPIHEMEGEIIERLREGRRLILQAPTGSGKSTQVPRMLLRHGLLRSGQVVILQPRRLAARLLAARVAWEEGCEAGEKVGYQIRFEDVTSSATRIRYVTEGVLLRQMLDQADLARVEVLIFDEFHERHLYGDVTLARALELQETIRPDLRIVVMSATLDAGRLQAYLEPCAVLTSEGRTFPVELIYARHRVGVNAAPVWERAAEAFRSEVRRGGVGDVLVFMPGGYEIQRTLEALRQVPESRGYVILPLHGELGAGEQDAAVARYDRPKVVVATNVAETSITIEGVGLVIDSGLARIPRYDPHRGINTLLVERISRSSADQRAGRAGRTVAGRCVRLWSEAEHAERVVHEEPEIKRLDLAEVALALKAAGVGDLRRFRWLEAPSERGLGDAETLLRDLGALDRSGGITGLGRAMLSFPVHPRYARMLLAARDHGCVYQVALFAALTQGRELLIRNPGTATVAFRQELLGEQDVSDFWVLMRAWSYASKNGFRLEACRRAGIHAQTARQVGPLLDQFLRIAVKEGLEVRPQSVRDEALQRCVLSGFSDRVARRVDEGTLRCELVHGRRGVLARESVVQRSRLFVAAEVREVEGREKCLNVILSLATGIEEGWLREMFPEDVSEAAQVRYDTATRRVYAEEQVRFRDLVISSRRVEPPPEGDAARLLAGEVEAGRLVLREWGYGTEQWITRVNLLSRWCPELGLSAIGVEERRHMIEQLCHGAVSYKEIKDRPVAGLLRSWLSATQREVLERHAPERVAMGNGRSAKVQYVSDGAPRVSLRIQELYGVMEAPRVAMGRVVVLVEVLAPNARPVQVTSDMAGFWREHYPGIKQELERRYPKHEWKQVNGGKRGSPP